jgi:hypothetical protein
VTPGQLLDLAEELAPKQRRAADDRPREPSADPERGLL